MHGSLLGMTLQQPAMAWGKPCFGAHVSRTAACTISLIHSNVSDKPNDRLVVIDERKGVEWLIRGGNRLKAAGGLL